MKSERQAKFEAAVLRRLFFNSSSSSSSPSLPPPPPPIISSPSLVSLSIQGLQSHDLESQDEQENDGGPSGDEEAEAAKTSLTRAQRKRLKIKRLKEAKQKPSAPPGRFVGPLRPGEGSHVLTDGNSSASTKLSTASPHNSPDRSVERNIVAEADCERSPSSRAFVSPSSQLTLLSTAT
ncbi:hypothetical protein O6H91_05G038600 [Diphasiastrum complanatum]|uniref:Uncharacterized protein n=2 Tax=Diphasiastrum complanatum TaxID=34168 RepID=A0ACC2DN80_DIPCM|nr:hypothetical protein O6H91_05G038600 [Diphasiastrum complanatum]KAJ7555452.1 hypothetical protein O6H91_05G038600 [Diphasiastrum complanatum]